jgi:hypothetical protein
MPVDLVFHGPLAFNDPSGTPRLEDCPAAGSFGIYIETIATGSGCFLASYVGAAYGKTIEDRINERIDWDRHNDFKISADQFVQGRRAYLPGKRNLQMSDPNDRRQIDQIVAALRMFVAPIPTDDDYVDRWLGSKEVSNRPRYFITCVEHEVIKTIREASDRCAQFLWNPPKNYMPVAIEPRADGNDIVGLTCPDTGQQCGNP